MVTGISTTGFMGGIILIVLKKTAGKGEDAFNIMVLDVNTHIKCRYITSDDYFSFLLSV